MSGATARGHNPDDSAIKRRWRTPPALFAAEHATYKFGLDAAAEPGANLCPSYFWPGFSCLTNRWAPYCLPNSRGERWAWANFPWGPRFTACPASCSRDHVHYRESFPGTEAFVSRALDQAPTLTGVELLLPTAADTRWWRRLFVRAALVKLLPRVAYIDPDTGRPAEAPPGGGCTLFVLDNRATGPRRVVLADELGRELAETGADVELAAGGEDLA